MSVNELVLSVLEENKGKFVSGSTLAAEIGVSRNAVWKAVGSLRKKGHDIKAVTNKGYMLSSESGVISAQSVKKLIRHDFVSVRVLDSVDSTQSECRRMCENGARHGEVIVALEQTHGIGRYGREFSSRRGDGIYFSIILRPELSSQDCLLITVCAATAAAKAVELVSGRSVKIKWVNDLFIDGKKICGILTQASLDMESRRLAYAVLGIGVDVCLDEEALPQSLKGIAGSVFTRENKPCDAESRIVAHTVNFFFDEYSRLTEKRFFSDYKKRMLLTGREISVISQKESRNAVALGVDGDFRLRVRYEDGEEEALSSGEVSTKIN